ncbi:MAG: hypothetical protein U0103_24290 [Candidatus Obscuribacterales bacterium]|nr:hypothetical protein [Cyanobacteria bacterium SZAS LIN-5]
MHDGHGGHGDAPHGALSVDGDGHGGDHSGQYVAFGSSGSGEFSAAYCGQHEVGTSSGGEHSRDGVIHEAMLVGNGHAHSHENVIVHSHHTGVSHSHHPDLHHIDKHSQHFERAALLSALDPLPSAPLVFKTPTHKPDGEVIRSYVAYVDRHGQFDFIAELTRIAPGFGLIWLDKFRPNFDEVDLTRHKILDRKAWRQVKAEDDGVAATEVYCACQNEAAPGWYEGATGMTRLRRQHWHIGRVKGLLGMGIFGPAEYDPNAHTFLEIAPVEYSFNEAGDFSTAFEICIVSLPEFDHTSGQYGYRRESFERHQRVAIKIFEHMLSKLLLAEKTEAQKLLRENVDRKYALACKAKEPPKPPLAAVPGKEGEKADLVIFLDD